MKWGEGRIHKSCLGVSESPVSYLLTDQDNF
jgi:hypothetical protein